jgi:citronellol/citronellal dehydrogenase
MPSLRNKTIIITGASRGIGRAMAIRFARDGANIVVAAKTADPHPKLEGTIFDVAGEIESAGGRALAVQVDVRFEDQIAAMVARTVDRFGGIDVLINNAGAISLKGVEKTPVKRYDLMQSINARAVYLCSQAVLPHLISATNPHILSMSPPLNFDKIWLKDYAPYTLSKYGMTILTLGMSAEFEKYGVAVNCLWPRTAIATAAVEYAIGGHDWLRNCRKPEIIADAAYEILITQDRKLTGQALIDEDFLCKRGVDDFKKYAVDPEYSNELLPDFFL